MKLLCLLSLGLWCSLVISAPLPAVKSERVEKVEIRDIVPEFKDNTIVAGNKAFMIRNDGVLVMMADGEQLTTFTYHFGIKNTATGKDHYLNGGDKKYTVTDSGKVTRDGNTIAFSCQGKIDDVEWDFYRIAMTLQDNGLITIHTTWNPPPGDTFKVFYKAFNMNCGFDIFGGAQVTLNGQGAVIPAEPPERGKVSRFAGIEYAKSMKCVFLEDKPAKSFVLNGVANDFCGIHGAVTARGALMFILYGQAQEVKFDVDVRRGTLPAADRDIRGGVDFLALEKLTLPDKSAKNLLINPSFEQGFHGYKVPFAGTRPSDFDRESYELSKDTAMFGSTSLKVSSFKPELHGKTYFSGPPVIIDPGTYTLSFYAKADQPDIKILFPRIYGMMANGFNAYHSGIERFKPTPEWKRYSKTFTVKLAGAVSVQFYPGDSESGGNVFYDGIQLEKGPEATAFETRCVEGRFVTSERGNFIDAKSKINAIIELLTVPGISGKVDVKVGNFFNEEVYRGEFKFTADKNGMARINLPLDQANIGKGLMLVRADYLLDDGRKSFDFFRFSVGDYLANKHKNKVIFCENYSSIESRPEFERILDRHRKVGFGAAVHLKVPAQWVFERFKHYGINPLNSFMITHFKDPKTNRFAGFGILKPGSKRAGINWPPITADEPDWLIRDFKHDSNGEITPEYLAKLENAVKTFAAAYPHVGIWILGGEIMGKYPNEWWSKSGTPEAAMESWAKMLGAFVRGVKAANPAAKVSQDVPSSMSLQGGIRETDMLLEKCNEMGIRFDVIGIHPYRYSPENPDLDQDAQAMLQMMARRGYADAPMFWPEMMNWGPYNIPQWNIRSSSWIAGSYWFTGALSYDLGQTEKLSAAWRARSWLVALKYADRVITSCSGAIANNAYLDYDLTPMASHIIPNTLGNLLGNADFKQDIRFAPGIRAYVFEDEAGRPVAAVWSHLEKIDAAKADSPVAEADFGNLLEGVFDLMNTPRDFTPGKFRFPVTPFPMFLRGKPGSMEKFTAALSGATVISGEGAGPIKLSINPLDNVNYRILAENYISRKLTPSLNGKTLELAPNSTATVDIPLEKPLAADKITAYQIPGKLTIDGKNYESNLSFEAFLCRETAADATFENIQWDNLPSIAFTRSVKPGQVTGAFRTAWNKRGLFLEVKVNEPNFVHEEFKNPQARWNNDCVQIYFDTLADARRRDSLGFDENDYSYAIFPNAAGTLARVFRYYSVDPQLGLTTQAPKDNTFADDIPCSFSKTAEGYTYRVFFPAKYLLPLRLEKGTPCGFSLFAPNVDNPGAKERITSWLTLSQDGRGGHNKPHLYPVMLLW